MEKFRVKYLVSAAVVLLFAQLVFGFPASPAAGAAPLRDTLNPASDSAREAIARQETATPEEPLSRRERRRQQREAREAERRRAAFDSLPQQERDSLFSASVDSLVEQKSAAPQRDSSKRKGGKKGGAFLEDIISGQNTDSLVYDVRNKTVYVYNEGSVSYQNSSLKADFMRINMDNKLIYAYGKADTVEGKPTVTKPEFSEGSESYAMDTIVYNIDTKKAKIKGVATQQGDGWLVGGSVKKMPDNTINIENGKYTTCENTDHPHFYLSMTKAKVIPGKKVVTGPAYLVMEDVPIYFLGIPEGFFPISSGPKSGLLMPTYG